jgi:DNA-binding transcriptional regulator YiaG
MYLADHCASEGRRLIPCRELRDALRLGKLNSFRNRHGLTWNYLSEQTGISPDILKHWAKGRAMPTRAERNEIICNVRGHLHPEDRGTYA